MDRADVWKAGNERVMFGSELRPSRQGVLVERTPQDRQISSIKVFQVSRNPEMIRRTIVIQIEDWRLKIEDAMKSQEGIDKMCRDRRYWLGGGGSFGGGYWLNGDVSGQTK